MNLEAKLRILKRAREAVSLGWCQGDYVTDSHTSYCPSGAIRFAPGNVDEDQIDKGHAEAALAQTVLGHVPYWNDCPGRTQQEVVDAIDVTIERVEWTKLRRAAEAVRASMRSFCGVTE